MKFSRVLLVLLTSCLTGAAWADDSPLADQPLQGAEAALRDAEAAAASPSRPNKTWPETIRDFTAELPTLPPSEAAQRWLELFDQAASTDADTRPGTTANAGIALVPQVFSVLPPPASWGELARLIQSRPLITATATSPAETDDRAHPPNPACVPALRILAELLLNHYPQAWQFAAEAADRAAAASTVDSSHRDLTVYAWEELLDILVQVAHDPVLARRHCERHLDHYLANPAGEPLQIPDILPLMGEEKTADFVRRALLKTTDAGNLSFDAGTPTFLLARRLALELVDQLQAPIWSLAQDPDSLALYDAFAKRFPPKPAEDPKEDPTELKCYRVLALLRADRLDEANALAQNVTYHDLPDVSDGGPMPAFPPETLHALEAEGLGPKIVQFLETLLRAHPDLPFWEDYTNLAKEYGSSANLLLEHARAEAAPRKGELALVFQRQRYARALLVAGQTEPGIELLRSLLARPSDAKHNYDNSARLDVAVALLELGRLLDRPALVDEAARAGLMDISVPNGSSYDNRSEGFADALVAAHRPALAEKLLIEQLGLQIPASRASARGESSTLYGPGAVETLTRLVSLYQDAGRFADVRTLLDHSPDWGAPDLAGFLGLDDYDKSAQLLVHAARALKETGDAPVARRVLDSYLDHVAAPTDDAYALLLALDSPAAHPIPTQLDALFARDPFEKRPLIWKAKFLGAHGQLDEAERTARRAIALDPSDGQSGKGDRMRAYAVLGEILARKGDQPGADSMRRVVAAIRESEDADDFANASLTDHALAMYEHALGTFSDAYCIEARLAAGLAEQNKGKEAQAHYRHAYELMPASFGRIESHCFGCEGAFAGNGLLTADAVFTRLATEQPNDPEVHYLLGYLRATQGRPDDALAQYRETVRLDRDHLNAWNAIAELTAKRLGDGLLHEEAAFNVLRLDPLDRHISVRSRLEDVTDLAALWRASAQSARPPLPPPPAKLYPLAASRDALGPGPKAGASDGTTAESARMRPANLVQQQKAVEALLKLMPPPPPTP